MSNIFLRIKIITIFLNSLEQVFFTPKFLNAIHKLSINPVINHKEFIVIDIGANRAQNTLLISKKFRIKKAILVEPNIELHQYIKKSLGDIEFKILDKCVTNYDGSIDFYVSNFDLTSSTIKPSEKSKYHKVKTKILGKNYTLLPVSKCCTTLRSIVNDLKIDYIDYLKIDVEGAEFFVLQGAQDLLKNSKIGIIQLEIHRNDMRKDYANEIFELLHVYNYHMYKKVRHSFGNFVEYIYISSDVFKLLRDARNDKSPKKVIS